MSSIFWRISNEIFGSSSFALADSGRQGLSCLLNQMTEYVCHDSRSDKDDQSIIFGLEILLLSDIERVRSASIRALRYYIHRQTILENFLQYRLDYLICRSLIVDDRNNRERLESYKFLRRLIHLYPLEIPHSFVYVLDSILSSNSFKNKQQQEQSHPMIKPSLQLLCEIALVNPHLLEECHVINTMVNFIVDREHEWELVESVIYALLHLIDRLTINDNSCPSIVNSVDPNGPPLIFLDEGMRQRHLLITNIFSQVLVGFLLCEKENVKQIDCRRMTPALWNRLTIKDFEGMRKVKSSYVALLTILHSWIGFTAFCQSTNSSIHLLVNCLIVQSESMKLSILDFFYALLNLDSPSLSDTYESAMKSINPLWNLTTNEHGYGYVAAEGAAKLPRLSSTRPNLLDSHLALILLTLIDAGFLEAITEIASGNNTILSIRATLLLANFIWLCNEHLPEEQSFLLLPLLMDIAIADDQSVKRSIAKEAMLQMNSFFEMKNRTRHTYSFQLAQLISHSQHFNDYFTSPQNLNVDLTRRKAMVSADDPLAAEKIDQLIGETNILQKNDFRKWNWDLILALLKDFPRFSTQVEGDLFERFLDKLSDFFKVDQRDEFAQMSLSDRLSNVTCRCLIAYSDLLVIASNIVRTLLININDALKQSITSYGQGLFNEQDLLTKNFVYYYLFLGRLTRTSFGTEVLNQSEIFLRLSEMLKMSDQFATSVVVALSSLNYYYDGPSRQFLRQTLQSFSPEVRLYSTSLLRVILRLNPVAFGQWGLTLLCQQLNDSDQRILLETVSILDEALEDKRLVHFFHKEWRRFSEVKEKHSYLNDTYHLLCARLCSVPFDQIDYDQENLSRIHEELSYWDQIFNRKYVQVIETRLFAACSGGPLLTDDYFQRRKTSSSSSSSSTDGLKLKKKRENLYMPPHIYRQLCLHNDGLLYLCSHSRLEEYARQLKQHPTNCIHLDETQTIKEALWALAHTASTENGFNWLIKRDLLADFLRFAEECQNLSVRGTAFYGLSLIAQTPDGAMSLKNFGWETYRVRAHSVPFSLATTDSYLCAERRMTRTRTTSIPLKNLSEQINEQSNDQTPKKISNTTDQSSHGEDSSLVDTKSKRSSTMPSSILLHSNDKSDLRQISIVEQSGQTGGSHLTATVSFRDGLQPGDDPILVTVPIRRSPSLSKELLNFSMYRDSNVNVNSGRPASFSEVESIRSSSYETCSYHNQQSSSIVQSVSDSLPLERLRPRTKSEHQSNAMRQAKQLQKVPAVIKALRAPTETQGRRSELSAIDELYRSRLLRCNFLLKPDAAGYEYARRVQELSHATYTHLNNSNQQSNDNVRRQSISIIARKDQWISPFHPYTNQFYTKFYQPHSITNQQIDKFTTDDGKFSLEQPDLDDADEDGNTIYRGLAVPVDIRQVVEISDGSNLNYETWSDLLRSRSRANTNADQTRTRSATNASNTSQEKEFGCVRSLSPTVDQNEDQLINEDSLSSSSSSFNICMMCDQTSHEDRRITTEKDFLQIKSLASRLIVDIHSGDIEKQLLSLKEQNPASFDNICLYSEICSILTLSSVRLAAQRFLHDLFSDCRFEKLRKRRCQYETLVEEDEQTSSNNHLSNS